MDDIFADEYGGSTGAGFAAQAPIEPDALGGPGGQCVRSLVGLEEVVWASPVFVVGCPRSGTTLVQTLLDSHPRLNVLYEADFLVDIPLGLRSGLANASEAVTLAEAHPSFRADTSFRADSFDARTARTAFREFGITDAAGAMRVLAASQALAQGKRRWGNKTPKALLHMAELAIVYPNAQFIHMIRDGRDSAASNARGPSSYARGDRNLVQNALLWRAGVRAGRRAGSHLGPARYLEVRLEKLLSSPEEQIRRMCAFLGEDFDQSLLHFHATARERIPPSHIWIHPRLGEPPRPLPPSRDGAAKGLAQRAAAVLIDSELVELGYVPAASSGRCMRIVYVIIGYAFFLVTLRRNLRALLRHFARSGGAHRAARRVMRQSADRQVPGATVPRPAATAAAFPRQDHS
jgi:hypothetical protein